jgi:hypothetical protein
MRTRYINSILFLHHYWIRMKYIVYRFSHYSICFWCDVKDVTTPYTELDDEPNNFICDNMIRIMTRLEDLTRTKPY